MAKETKIFPRKFSPTRILRELGIGQQYYFTTVGWETVKVLASRVGKTSKPVREYTTQKEKGGTVVFRDK